MWKTMGEIMGNRYLWLVIFIYGWKTMGK
jgi:hypothetical protein